MIYFDASYVVRLYFEDTGWQQVRAAAQTDHVACCIHGQAETIGAFHRKLREGAIETAEFQSLLDQFAADCRAHAFNWLPLSPSVMGRLSAVYANLPGSVTLRAADAIHLACASESGLKEIYSNDRQLLVAAPYFSIKGVNLI